MPVKIGSKSLSSFSYFIIFLIPIFRYYDVPGTEVSSEIALTFLLLCCLIVIVLIRPVSIIRYPALRKSRVGLEIFAFWAIIITIIYELFTSVNIKSVNSSYSIFAFIGAIQVLVIILLLLSGKVSTCNAVKIYSYFVYIVLVIYGIQWSLMYNRIAISFKIPLHSFNESWALLSSGYFGMNGMPTSVFSERAHFSQYVLPYIAICLYNKNMVSKYRILKAIIVSVSVISTVSGNGIVSVGILWLLYFLYFSKVKQTKRFFMAIGGCFALIGIYIFLQRFESFNAMFLQLFSDKSNNSYYYSKADYRIYRGFDIFLQLPILQKIVGVGYKHMNIFASLNGIVSKYDSPLGSYEYFSTITQVLLYFGLAGFVLFIRHIYCLFSLKNRTVRGLIILLLAIWSSSQMLFDYNHIQYLAVIVAALSSTDNINSDILNKKYCQNAES